MAPMIVPIMMFSSLSSDPTAAELPVFARINRHVADPAQTHSENGR